jgi:hypothetical protein
MRSFLRNSLLGALLLGGSTLVAQTPDKLLDEAKKKQEIATQQVEADLRATLQQSAKASPAEALKLLQATLLRIEGNSDMAASRKEGMVRMLKDRIRITEQLAKTSPEKPSVADDAKTTRASEKAAEQERQKAEREKIKAAISHIVQLQNKNPAEAEKQAKDLAAQYPDHPAARVMGRTGFLNARIRESRELLTEAERRYTAWSRDMDRSSLPITGDIEFDKKRWHEIAKLRKGEEISEKEKTILRALNSPIKAQWRNSALRDVIEYLSTVSGQVLFIDKRAMEELNLTEESPVSFFAPREVTMRTALRKILQDNGMTYVVKDEVIYITSQQRAKDMMVTKTYYVGDLTTGLGPLGNPLQVGPLIAAQQEMENARIIADMIKEQLDPSSWQGGGGAGTITYSPLNKAFIIRQSAEVHSLLKGGLLR